MPMLVAGTNTKAAACYSYVHKRPSLEMSDLSIIESVFFIFFYDSLFYDYNISFTKRRYDRAVRRHAGAVRRRAGADRLRDDLC